ncbi:hypothetical protein CCIPSID_15180 [Campylobacter coli IPSID-1]|nr:hypothetical protein CCIPSID_15180 [Campylobacter coli IPSID-1]
MLFLSTASGWEHSRALDFSVCRSHLGKGLFHLNLLFISLKYFYFHIEFQDFGKNFLILN